MAGTATLLALLVAVGADQVVLAPDKGGEDQPAKCTAPFKFEKKNKILQAALERKIEAEGWNKYIKQNTLSVAVVDLTRRGKRYYAGINDNNMMYSASLPKIAILLTVVELVNNGTVEWTHEFDTKLQEMITASSNQDASWGVDIAGLANIEKTMRDPKYCLYDSTYGGLWIGRAYRPGGATKPDPKGDVSHGATARQAARFYTMLDAGQLVSKHWSFRMLGLMSPPKHFHKFVGGLSDRQGVVFLARKSGTWRNYHADSALIQHFGSRYVLVGLSEVKDGEQIMRQLARDVDDIIMAGAHRKSTKKTGSARR
jgi:beta-lactamase class A